MIQCEKHSNNLIFCGNIEEGAGINIVSRIHRDNILALS